MKFLFFNTLVGGALAWLLLGGSTLNVGSFSWLADQGEASSARVACPASANPETTARRPMSEEMRGVTTAAATISDASASALAKSDVEPPVTPTTTVQPSARPDMVVGTSSDAYSPEAVAPKPLASALNRRDALLSLAERMELFSVERIVR